VEQADIGMQRSLVALQRQHVIAALIDDLLGDGALAVERVGGNDRALQAEHAEQLGHGGDLFSLKCRPFRQNPKMRFPCLPRPLHCPLIFAMVSRSCVAWVGMAEDLTILIANLGRIEHLRPCLTSIFDGVGAGISHRVIVGFNFAGESDTPRALAREFPQVEQFRVPLKLGYCRAYNQLMARSTGRYVLLLDDDTVLRAGTLDGMVRFMDAHPQIGIAGCRTVSPDGSYQKTTALMFDLRTEFRNIWRPAAFWDDGIDESVTTWREAGWLNGHFLMVRAELVEQVGMLDERYYTFQCEADWCLRARGAGWQIAYVPEFEVMHIGGAHSVGSTIKTYNNLIRSHINRYYFIRKHYGDRAVHAFRGIMSIGAVLRLFRYAALWLAVPRRRPEAGPKLRAYGRIALLGAARRPERLPEELCRESVDVDLIPATLPEVKSRRNGGMMAPLAAFGDRSRSNLEVKGHGPDRRL
jgi:GT2 family glycosyltransferase